MKKIASKDGAGQFNIPLSLPDWLVRKITLEIMAAKERIAQTQ